MTSSLDINLLYGEMIGSWMAHIGIAVGVSMFLSALPMFQTVGTSSLKVAVYLGCCMIASFITQALLLMILQSSSCSGMKSYFGVFVGAAIAAGITGIMMAIPAFIEPMRLVVSQLFGPHRILVSPEMERITTVVTDAAMSLTPDSSSDPSSDPSSAPGIQGGLKQSEYDQQTFHEITAGAGFWGAFAGAYGIGIGSLFAAKCPAVT